MANRISAELTLKKYDSAIETSRKALAIATSRKGFDPNTIAIIRNKHLIALHLGDKIVSTEAIREARESLPILIETYGQNHPFVTQCITTIDKTTQLH